MAHDVPDYATADGNDYPEHERTYEFFLGLVKWHLIIIACILALMAYFLT